MKEKININNYEAWWVDYLDGRLSESEEEKLFTFLESNTEISANLIDSDDYALPIVEMKFPSKNILKAENQIEYLLIAKTENVINAEEDSFIVEKINSDPKIAKSYGLYQKAVAKPNNDIVFKGKKYLKKKEVIPLYKYSAVAAVFAAVFIIGYLLTGNVSEFDQGQPAQISFFQMPQIIPDTLNKKDEIFSNQTNYSEKIIYASTEISEEVSTNRELKKIIEIPERLPLSKIEKTINYCTNNEEQLLAYNINQPQLNDVAFEYEFQYVKSTKENKFKAAINKVYDFGKRLDLVGSFDRLKIAKEDLFITMSE